MSQSPPAHDRDAPAGSAARTPPRPAPPPGAWRSRGALVVFLLVASVLLAVDLASKRLSFERVAGVPVSTEREPDGTLAPVPPHEGITVVPSLLELRLTWNHGAVFGIGQGRRTVFVGFSVVAVVVIATLFARSRPHERLLHLSLASVLAGALGNMYDRVVFGAVRDMLHLFPGVPLPFGLAWPDGSRGLYPWIFNVADVCLVLGLLVLLVLAWRADTATAATRRPAPAGSPGAGTRADDAPPSTGTDA